MTVPPMGWHKPKEDAMFKLIVVGLILGFLAMEAPALEAACAKGRIFQRSKSALKKMAERPRLLFRR